MCKWGTHTTLSINNKSVFIDSCIASIVEALNAAGIKTIASCCGHKRNFGSIVLADGRELLVCKDFDTARKIDALFENIHGEH